MLANPSNGSMVKKYDNTFTYTPNAGYVGLHVFHTRVIKHISVCFYREQ